jgi:hypothetical protein
MQDFFALFFEFFGTVKTAAADDLYDLVYIGAGFIWIFCTIGFCALYYQGFFMYQRQAKWDTFTSWFSWGLISSLLTTLFIWLLTINKFQNNDSEFYLSDYMEFLFIAFAWAFILYFLVSLGMKFTNPGRKKIPF